MPKRATPARAYKEITLQQLRSFCELARQGSLSGAARSLKLAHPTVWKQVHALEKTLGTRLVETNARGSKLTPAGHVLLQLAIPSVANLDVLPARFAESMEQFEIRLTLASYPRVLSEDVPAALPEFFRRWPRVRLTLLEVVGSQVVTSVEDGVADMALSTAPPNELQRPQLLVEPWYELDTLLLMPSGHPLATRRTIRPQDVAQYPLVNSTETLGDRGVHAAVECAGLFAVEPRRVIARHGMVLRRLVEQGLGLALLAGRPSAIDTPRLAYRDVSRYFGRSRVQLLRRAGALQHPAVQDLADSIRRVMTAKSSRQARPLLVAKRRRTARVGAKLRGKLRGQALE